MTFTVFDPAAAPHCLGRLRGLDARYRLRDLDEELDQLPGDLEFEVLDDSLLDGPLLTNREGLVVATEAGRAILESAGLSPICTASVDDVEVFIFRPEEEVESDPGDDAIDEDSDYPRLASSSALTVDADGMGGAMARVAETRLVVFDDMITDHLRAAGLSTGVCASPTPYGPVRPSPWYVVRAARARKVAQFDGVAVEGASASDLPPTNPLASFVRVDGQLVTEPDRFWGNPGDDDELLRRLYASGAPLPAVTLTQAPPKANKKRLDLAYTGYLIVSPATLELLAELGVDGDQAAVSWLDTKSEPMKSKGHVLFRARSHELIDWSASDVNFTGSHTIWGFRELELTEDANDDTAPVLAHIHGTRLHLAHQRFVDAVNERGLEGFEFVPVSEHAYAYNLDDELTDWTL